MSNFSDSQSTHRLALSDYLRAKRKLEDAAATLERACKDFARCGISRDLRRELTGRIEETRRAKASVAGNFTESS